MSKCRGIRRYPSEKSELASGRLAVVMSNEDDSLYPYTFYIDLFGSNSRGKNKDQITGFK